MRKLVFFFLFYMPSAFAAASEEPKLVGALSSWGTNKGICLINCDLNVCKGRVIGWLRLGESWLNHDVADTDGMSFFDPLSVKKYITDHFDDAMKEAKRNKRPSTHYTWCYEAFAKLQSDFSIEAKKRLTVPSVEAVQLAFFVGRGCSVIYACHKRDQKDIFPPIQLIEFFSDVRACRDGMLVLTADAIAKDDGICKVHEFPSKKYRPLSIIYPKNVHSVQRISIQRILIQRISIQRIIDELVPRILTQEKRPFTARQSKGLIVALDSLYHQLEDVDDAHEDQCVIA